MHNIAYPRRSTILFNSLIIEIFIHFPLSYCTRAIISRSWIQAIHKDRIFWKNLLKNKEIVFENGVKNIQAAAYNSARTVFRKKNLFSMDCKNIQKCSYVYLPWSIKERQIACTIPISELQNFTPLIIFETDQLLINLMQIMNIIMFFHS